MNYENGQTWDISNNVLSVYDAYQGLIIFLDDTPIDYSRGPYFDKRNRAWVHTQLGVYLIELKRINFLFSKILNIITDGHSLFVELQLTRLK
jgi:ligand-binding sensor domain-containing protein